jgi:hypothetical protein
MQRSRIMLATAVLFTLSAASVCAQETPAAPAPAPATPAPSMPSAVSAEQSGLPSFDELDKAHQGYISRADLPKDVEGLKPLRAHFMDYDKNQNGRLDPDEYAAYAATQSGAQQP